MTHVSRSLFNNLKSGRLLGDRRKAANTEAHRRSRNSLRISPQAELLEQKLVLTDPGMPLTTLAREEMAMGFLTQFEQHHTPAALTMKMSDRNYFVVGRDFNTADAVAPKWSDSRNWLKYTYDTTSSSYLVSPYNSVPITGDNVRVPAGLTMIYDITSSPVSVGSAQLDPSKDMQFVRLTLKELSGLTKCSQT